MFRNGHSKNTPQQVHQYTCIKWNREKHRNSRCIKENVEKSGVSSPAMPSQSNVGSSRRQLSYSRKKELRTCYVALRIDLIREHSALCQMSAVPSYASNENLSTFDAASSAKTEKP